MIIMSPYFDHPSSNYSHKLELYKRKGRLHIVFLVSILRPHNVIREEYYCSFSCLLYGGYHGYSLLFLSCTPELVPAWEKTLKGQKGLNSATGAD